MRVDGFRPADEFKSHMDQWIRRFRGAVSASGQESVLVPGDPERASEKIRMAEGVPLLEAVVNDLNAVATKMGLSFGE